MPAKKYQDLQQIRINIKVYINSMRKNSYLSHRIIDSFPGILKVIRVKMAENGKYISSSTFQPVKQFKFLYNFYDFLVSSSIIQSRMMYVRLSVRLSVCLSVCPLRSR